MPCNKIQEILDNGGSLIDVRSISEHSTGSIPGALNIPLQQLRWDTESINKDQPVLLFCRSGARSGMAQQLLSRMGFDAHNIGGYSNFQHC